MKGRPTFVVLSVAVTALASAQSGPMTERQVKETFDAAMRKQDGKLLLQVLRQPERKGIDDAACTQFLRRFVKPWYEGPSLQMGASGRLVNFNSPECRLVVTFGPKGGARYQLVDRRTLVFDTPVIKEGKGYKASVTFGQILFAIGQAQANSPGRDRLEEIKMSQRLVESWVPVVQKMGIAGSVDPETGRYMTWPAIVKSSREEIAKIEKSMRGGGR